GHRRPRQVRRADAAAHPRAHLQDPRPRLRLPRLQADPDVPPRVSPPQPVLQARGLGRYEARSQVAERVVTSSVRLKADTTDAVIVHVAVPVPGLGLLTYRVPDGFARPVVGARVVVPLGSR